MTIKTPQTHQGLEQALVRLKDYGKGAIMRLGPRKKSTWR